MTQTEKVATLVAAHQTAALADIVQLCDDGLAGRGLTRDVLLDIRLIATTELNTRVPEEATR